MSTVGWTLSLVTVTPSGVVMHIVTLIAGAWVIKKDTTQVVGACFTLTGENFSEFTSDLNITVSIFRKICRKFLDFDNAVDRILTIPTTCFTGAVEAAVPMNSRQ